MWRFCPKGRLITAWQAPASDKLPKVLIYDVHLRPISQLDGVVALGGKLLREQSWLLVPKAELADRPDGDAVLRALHPLMQSLSGLVSENGFDFQTPRLDWNRQGGVLLVTGFVVGYKREAGADLVQLIPRRTARLRKEVNSPVPAPGCTMATCCAGTLTDSKSWTQQRTGSATLSSCFRPWLPSPAGGSSWQSAPAVALLPWWASGRWQCCTSAAALWWRSPVLQTRRFLVVWSGMLWVTSSLWDKARRSISSGSASWARAQRRLTWQRRWLQSTDHPGVTNDVSLTHGVSCGLRID